LNSAFRSMRMSPYVFTRTLDWVPDGRDRFVLGDPGRQGPRGIAVRRDPIP